MLYRASIMHGLGSASRYRYAIDPAHAIDRSAKPMTATAANRNPSLAAAVPGGG